MPDTIAPEGSPGLMGYLRSKVSLPPVVPPEPTPPPRYDAYRAFASGRRNPADDILTCPYRTMYEAYALDNPWYRYYNDNDTALAMARSMHRRHTDLEFLVHRVGRYGSGDSVYRLRYMWGRHRGSWVHSHGEIVEFATPQLAMQWAIRCRRGMYGLEVVTYHA